MNKQLVEIEGVGQKEAYLVGGPEGVFGVYREGPMLYLISGDDGGWWPGVTGMHQFWYTEAIEAITKCLDGKISIDGNGINK